MEKIDKSRFAWVGSDPEKREGISRPSVTYWKDAMGRLMKNKVAMVCLVIIVLIILSCVIVPFVTPFESREQHLGEPYQGFFTPLHRRALCRAERDPHLRHRPHGPRPSHPRL